MKYLVELMYILLTFTIEIGIIKTKYSLKYDCLNKIFILSLYIACIFFPFLSSSKLKSLMPILNGEIINPSIFLAITLLLALGLVIYSVVFLLKIINTNIKATNGCNATPKKLITNGFYHNVRHPMFGMIGLFLLSWNVLWGFIGGLIFFGIYLVMFYYDAKREEKLQLIPIFGQDYIKYQKDTQRMLFSYKQSLFILVLLSFWVSSLCF